MLGLAAAALLGLALLSSTSEVGANRFPTTAAITLACLCLLLVIRNHQRMKALARSREDLNRAQAVAHIGSWHIRSPRGEIDWSDETYRIFNVSLNTPITLDVFMEHVHPNDRQLLEDAWMKAISGAEYDLEHRILVDARVRWVRERADIRLNDDGEFIEATGTVEDITRRKAVADELTRSEQRLRELGAHHERLREAERAHVAREIHDELGQYLTSLRMDASMLQITFGPSDPRLTQRLVAMKGLIDETIASVRRVATSLRPASLDLGLTSAIEWLVCDFRERTGIDCDLRMDEDPLENIDNECATMVFRVLQEALTNVIRHSGATHVAIEAFADDDFFMLIIRDDGSGFDSANAANGRSFGLLGMHERAIAFGGQIDISSMPGSGTKIRLRLPRQVEPPCPPNTPYAPCHACKRSSCLPLTRASVRCEAQ